MRVTSPPLLPILRSQIQGVVLATTYLSPGEEFSVTQLAGIAEATITAAAHEVDRLVDTGYLADRRLGNMRLVRRPPDNLITGPLTDLLAVTFGPLPVLVRELSKVKGIEQAYLYGSWAARYSGEVGGVPGDVDVLAIGHPSLDALDSAASAARTVLRREVSIRRVSPEYWANPDTGDTFMTAVQQSPLVSIPGGLSPVQSPKGQHLNPPPQIPCSASV
ncbi:MAG: ArsR family transcriptional regulator [Propionibacteriaceae bacterium]|jgi:hypothetical protein|nr:ArsR family transcriptional regulator [Propionibacteriaceae bacterium]